MRDLQQKFKNFGLLECEGSSPFYQSLSLKIAEDDQLLQLADRTQEGQPVPNMFFGAVHYLLMKGYDHPLRQFYPSLVSHPRPEQEAFPPFKSFCLENKRDILSLLKQKRVQTNEVGRCAYLYPIFCYIQQKANQKLALIEIGTSAGLQLLCDRYAYSYGGESVYGNPSSSLTISSKVRRGTFPAFLTQPPVIAERVGVDLHINDLSKKEDELWLKALIWPEHSDRRENFEQAVRHWLAAPPELREGDGVNEITELSADIPSDRALCIFHTHVANQIPENAKKELLHNIEKIGRTRTTFHVYNNIHDNRLYIDAYVNGRKEQKIVGETEGHGRWFDWSFDF
ncbi:DUF2332 domain-containing protein [Halobacillus litoralis]|uniref:DUF2332 domain-containing protein n=1 Tax=Halobacillus litoralis TaxID=45668 RepID=UPI00299D2DC2|nr:DUF2332 domain-containing protein [Halobacillus litoralis]